MNFSISFVFLLTFSIGAFAYKPVVIIHGVLSGNFSMVTLADRIRELHPGTEVYAIDRFDGWSSLKPMWHQVLEIGADVDKFMAKHPSGVHLLGYSQGGLLARGILELFNNHTVQTFISLSSPQCGQYGTEFLHIFFPTLACETAYELFYSIVGQHTSVGNYWNDPHHQKLFLEYSTYLPYINNILPSPQSASYREGILKLKKMVLIGGPDDEVITPWQSSHFGCYDSNETVVELRDQGFYKNDSFGLQTLDKQGKLIVEILEGNHHLDWHINLTVIDNYIIPHLD